MSTPIHRLPWSVPAHTRWRAPGPEHVLALAPGDPWGHARDLYERAAFYQTTDFEAIQAQHYLHDPVRDPRRIVPRGGRPDLHAPHRRAELGSGEDAGAGARPDRPAQ